jgi:Uma2 family endonuclease
LIIEVLSPSTEAYDRGEKFAGYRELQSFSEYLLISQLEPLVDHYIKQTDSSWKFLTHKNLARTLKLETINCTLSLKDIYRRVNFENNDG